MIMKKFAMATILLAGAIAAIGQTATLSPKAATLLHEVQKSNFSVADLDERYPLVWSQKSSNDRRVASVIAYATLAKGVDPKALEDYGVRTGTVAGDVVSLTIPVDCYAALAASGICTHIDLGFEMKQYMNMVRPELNIDNIHRGIDLPQGYDGSGVVVGIIDNGFGYNHPTYLDTTGNVLRIKRVWHQLDSTGTAPSSLGYGSEYTTPAEILSLGTDYAETGHGCHVAGIAAGCGAPNGHGANYRGIAPGADIVLVSYAMTSTYLLDAIRYIHEYARSVHKPCVINMSFGNQMGPHDGQSVIDIAVKNYVESVDSLVLVCSAGNSGNQMNHLHHQFTDTDTAITTFFRAYTIDNYYRGATLWGNAGDVFRVRLSEYSYDNAVVFVQNLIEVESTADTTFTTQLVLSNDTVIDCEITVVTSDPFNNKTEVIVILSKTGRVPSGSQIALNISSTSADIHAWSNEEFFHLWKQQFKHGDNEYCIGGACGNTDAVISVGSYVTRSTSDMRIGGGIATYNPGDLAGSSSHGPTIDGRVKPDICAPGTTFSSYVSNETTYNNDQTEWNGHTWKYTMLEGSSMSSPAVAGVIALWMQRFPSLNVNTARELLHNTARTDNHTGEIPAGGSNSWGWGKVNAWGGFTDIMGIGEVNDNDFRVVNLGNGRIAVEGADGMAASVYDIMGRCVHNAPAASGNIALPASGVYIVRVGGTSVRKVVVTK